MTLISSESEGIKFSPEYEKRTKKIYANRPVKVSTVITLVIVDTYGISIKTPSGDYCIFNDFEFSDYYKKVYNKLKKFLRRADKLNIKADIFYHKIENSYECIGEVEDIILQVGE